MLFNNAVTNYRMQVQVIERIKRDLKRSFKRKGVQVSNLDIKINLGYVNVSMNITN